MTAREALEQAIEYFDQRDTNSAEYWTFTRTTREKIAAGLRTLLSDAAAQSRTEKK
jgi:hypothetical protein